MQSEQTNRPTSRDARRYHGLGGTPTYRTWYSMIERCSNPDNASWPFYGAMGVTVCERWLDIENFVADMGMRPQGKTLDRIRSEGNYEPGNCQWADDFEQNRNRRCNSLSPEKLAAIKSDMAEGMSQAHAARKHGIPQSTVSRAVRGITWSDRV